MKERRNAVMDGKNNLKETLIYEKNNVVNGGIYHRLQIDFAYNSNHIEDSRLTHDQTKHIYEMQTVGDGSATINDIFETVNHFRCFYKILDTIDRVLTEDYIKNIHNMLKTGTMIGGSDYALIGDYKKRPNFAGSAPTTAPEDVPAEMAKLISEYENKQNKDLCDIIDFHVGFERIHPFYDGSGRVGRLIMFKECLRLGIMPFLIADTQKEEYYTGLSEWKKGDRSGRLLDLCVNMQADMCELLKKYEID